MTSTFQSFVASLIVEIVRLVGERLDDDRVSSLRKLLEARKKHRGDVRLTEESVLRAFQSAMASVGITRIDSSLGVLEESSRGGRIVTEIAKKIIDSADLQHNGDWTRIPDEITRTLERFLDNLRAEGEKISSSPVPPVRRQRAVPPHRLVNVVIYGDFPQA